jgi:hypothetical protein
MKRISYGFGLALMMLLPQMPGLIFKPISEQYETKERHPFPAIVCIAFHWCFSYVGIVVTRFFSFCSLLAYYLKYPLFLGII